MDKHNQLYNSPIFPDKLTDGVVLYDLAVLMAMHGLAASGESVDVGRRAVDIANSTLHAMLKDHYDGASHEG
jgi:hypothetical protein